jgi:myo-inositol-1(or 4)-monophosphatase
LSPKEWEEFLVAATRRVWEEVAPLAGRPGRGKVVGTGAAGDRTIYADKVAEEILVSQLGEVEGVGVLSEEAGRVGPRGVKALAMVDPLDGSSNFERGIPFYCSSVAVIAGDPSSGAEVGVVRDLVTGDVYAARKGEGATKNGRVLRTSGTTDLSEAVVGIDISRSRGGLVAALAPLVEGAKRQVHLGANALELCYVAEGRTDAFVDLRGMMRVTDFAAADLIAREAGAVVTAADGGPLDLKPTLEDRFSFVASATPELHRKILARCGRLKTC